MVPALKNDEITILLDGKPLLLEKPSYIVGGRTMVLLRPLVAALGGSLNWGGNSGLATVGNRQVRFTLRRRVVTVDNVKYTLARPLILRRQRVYAPITLWRDLFSGVVEYQNTPCQVKIYSLHK